MKCVNRNSKDFKLLAEHYNLSINALELLTHKYWLETGNEDSFPSDVYIRAYKGEIPFESHVKGHKKLWEMRYASPKIVDTKEELWAEVHKTRNFFPAEAITVYSTFDDKYAIKVKEPVENISAINNLYRDNFTPQELKDYLRVSPGIPKDIIQKVPLSAITKEYLENIGEVVQMSVEPEKVDFTISANRPFSLDTSETRLVSTGGIGYNSVEQAFQHHKLLSVYDYLEEDKFEELSRAILAASPSKAREIGNKIPMSAAARQQWKDDSLEVLRTLMKESYVQNPKALEALLNTEDTILTVPANATGIDKEVPKILMDIREELKSENLKAENLKPDTAPKITPQLVKHLKEYAKLLGVKIKGRAEMQKFLKEKGITNIQQAIEENREMQEIKAKAIADGTFRKAPNGKPSNLTERQWLQVRTKAFKEWFGDWMHFDKANPYSSKIFVTNVAPDYDSADAEGPGAMFAIFEGDTYIGSIAINANYKGKNQFKTWGEKGTNYVSMSSVGDAVEIEEEFRGKGYGKAAYFEFAKQMANMGYVLRSAPAKSRTEASTRVWKSLVRDGYAKEAGDRYEFINSSLNNASKVVDENGEPLVVYHHTNAVFDTFDTEKQTYNEFYFTTSASEENIYYPNSARSKFHLPVFLNIRVLEYANGTESEVPLYKSEELYKRSEEAIKEAENLYNIRNELAKKKAPVDEIREITKKAKEADKKAELIEEEAIVDFGKVSNNPRDSRFYFPNASTKSALGVKRGWVNGESLYIVFKPNQIKSATDNNGMFSTENDNIQMFIGKDVENTEEGRGVTIQTEALNITGNKFKNSLYRGQGYAPIIDAEGNLHLHTHYDSLSKLKTLSFDSTLEGAEHYGNRAARHPYIIEVDEEFLDTVVPKGEYEREKVNNGESFRYDEEFNEVRLSFKDELIIPKGKFNITQSNETIRFETFNDVMANIGWIQSLEKRAEIEEYNGASEITGRVHENDIKALSNVLHNTLGTYEGYDISTILYDVLALQNDIPGSPIEPSRQYKEFINKGLIEEEYQDGYTYYRPSKALIKHLTKKLGLKEVSETSQPIFYQNPHIPYAPHTSFVDSNDSELPFFMTPQGEIYGFVDKEDNIYLDETVISPEHPIHEYTHLWDRIVAKKNPKLWKRGIELMKQTSLWKQIENDPNYGQKWKDLKITGSKLESLIASEVHARFTGEGGENLLEQLAKEKGEKGIVDKLKEWMQEFWQDLKATFSNWSEEDLQNLTLKDFNHMVVRDFADAVNFNEQPSLNIQDTAKPEKVETSTEQRIVQNFDNVNTQFNNLLDSDLITSSEIRHVAEMVVNSISDMVTDIQEGKVDVAKEFPLFKTDFDFNGASRKDIFRVIGIDRLLSKAKENFKPINAKYDGIDTTRKAFLILDNWDAFILRANDLFAQNEGFGIVKNYNLGDFSITQRLDGNFGNFNNYQDIEDIEETFGNAQEHWQVEYDTVDILQALSENEKVKVALQKCYILDSEGNIVKNEEWGINERIPLRQSMNSIIQWTQGSLSLKDMIAKLEAKRAKNPWLSQIIGKLTDTSGKESDFQSQFFGTFSKPFQLYGIVVKEDGKFKVLPVNKNLALTDIIQSIDSLSKTGNHALFGNNRININYLGTSNSKSSAFTLHTALKQLQSIKEETKDKKLLSDENLYKSVDIISGICKILEYPIDEEVITSILDTDTLNNMVRNLEYMVSDLDNAYKKQQETLGSKSPYEYNPFNINQEYSIGGSIRRFYEPMANEIQNKRPNAFYDSGKMRQSYILPSFLNQLVIKFKTLKGQDFRDWIMKEYGSSQWFKTSGNTATSQIVVEQGWRNGLLRELVTNSKSREEFDHKVELNFNKHNYMKNMSDAEYTLSVIAEYWSNKSWDKAKTFTWFRVPMQSNKPSPDFLKLPSYREESTYKDTIVEQLYNFYSQEISRIQTVLMRNLTEDDPRFIENFDTNGKKFCFLPFLNAYIENSPTNRLHRVLLRNNEGEVSEDNNKLASLLQKKIARKQMSSEEEATLIALVKKAIKQHMEDRTSSILEDWEQTGIVDEVANIDGIPNEESEILKRLENFIWNDSLASKNILELTVGDISFYKDAEDLQKRLAQLHAPGIKPNIYATDYGTETREPERVSDGIYRTLVLSDFDSFKSNIIANISEVFDRKIARAPETQQKQLTALKDYLVGEDGVYRKINVTDAQAFNSPSSYRKKALMFGKWSEKAEKLYNNILDLNFKHTDFETAFQPLKPFVYTHLHKDLGVPNAPISNMSVPFQAKNAEYLLIMADAIIKKEVAESGELSRPNLLKAVYDVMEESEKINPTKGIDTVQFTSAIKSGLQAPIDLNVFMEVPGGEKAAYNFLMNSIYKRNSDGTRSTLYNTDTFIHEAPYEDYKLQQEVPEHFKNHFQAHGSQERMIIPSDLDDYKNPKGDLSAEENQVFYTWKEADGTIKKLRANEFKKEYEETIAANIEAKLEEVSRIFHLDSPNKRERNIAISAELQKEILSSPRYGTDLIQACSVDMTTGEFRIPKGDPIQSKRIEQLLNSIVKNKVNKQEIAGGPLVQVTNWGTSKQLKIRFHTKDGGILMTEEEYKKSGNTESYKEYCKKYQAGIAYFEVFAPIWSDELYDKFADENGDIDIQAIEATNPELLKLITYRIPTEDKYSIAPCKIVGFMPKEAGDIMMLPYELTSIDDSDFDVDKRYVMRKELPIAKRPYAEIKEKLFNITNESYKKQHKGKENKKFINEEITQFLDNPQKMKNADKLTQWLYRQYRRIAYKTVAPTKEAEPKLYRDNKIIDMNWAVLTNEMTADKILNPGGFDLFKKLGYMMEAYRENNDMYSWENLQNMTTNELKNISYTEKDLTFIDTQIQFYKQNSAAASLIGVFAVSKIAHAVLEGDDIWIDVNKVCGNTPFTIAGKEFPRKMSLDPKYDDEGNLIGKTLGAGVSASADAAKSPVLNLMNINMATVNIFTSLLRLGMEPEKAALFMSQKAIASIVDEFNKRNLTDHVTLDAIIKEKIQAFAKEHKLESSSNINTEELTEEELIEGVTNAEHAVIDYKVWIALQKIQKLADAIKKPSFATRFNSISSAVGPLIIDNLITENKIRQFKKEYMENGTPFYDSEGIRVDIDNIFYNHPILKNFSKTLNLTKRLFQDMPANSNAFRTLLDSLPKNMANTFYKDKKMLDDLSTFYTSYLLIQSGFINPEELQRYVYNFPKYFKKQNFKQKYADNPFINAIDFTTNRSGNVALKINMTGLDESAKEILRAGWVDLHKDNPNLSLQLFTYSFFIGGTKFSPKTFMALVPTYVKERLIKTLSDGSTTSYVGTYRKLPEVSPSIVLDMFIRNNWENTKLVPIKKYQKDIFVDMEKGTLKITGKENLADLGEALYIKTQAGPNSYNLWRLKEQEDEEALFEKISPLGNNHEYLEIYLNPDTKALKETSLAEENLEVSELETTSPMEEQESESTDNAEISEEEQTDNVRTLTEAIMKQVPSFSENQAENKIEEMKENPKLYGGFLQNVFKQMGITLDKEKAIKKFKKMC